MDNKSLKKKMASGFFWKFGERILAQGISFAISVVLARLLSPSEFGIVAIIMIFITLANVFVTSGFAIALIQKSNADETDFSTNYYCSSASSLLIYVGLFFVSPLIADFYHMPELCRVLRVFSLQLPINALSSIQHAYVEKHMMFRKFFFSTLLGTIVSGVVGIIMAWKGFGVWALVAQSFTNSIIDTIILFITVPWRPRLLFSWQSAGSMIGFSWKVLAADLSGTFFNELRSLLIGKFYTSSDLAFYNKGKHLPDLIMNNISTTIMTVLFPAIASINDDRERVKSLTRRAVSTIAYFLFPALFGLAAVARPLTLVLYGEVWISSVPYVQILCFSSVFSLIGSVSLQSLKALGRSDILLKLEFVKKPIYLFLLILGIKINVLAVALTMLIYTFCSSLINAIQLKRIEGYSFSEQVQDIVPSAVLALIMSVFVYMVSMLNVPYYFLLIVQIILGTVFYILLSFISRNFVFCYFLNLIKQQISKNHSIKDNE